MKDIGRLEEEVYEWQVKVLNIQVELLEEDQSLVKHRIAVRNMEMASEFYISYVAIYINGFKQYHLRFDYSACLYTNSWAPRLLFWCTLGQFVFKAGTKQIV